MTALIGLLCSDGVIIGSDSSATSVSAARLPTIESTTTKVIKIRDQMIVAGTGQVGLGQRFCHIADQIHQSPIFSQHPPIVMTTILAENAIKNFAATGVAGNGQYGALLAYFKGQEFYLVEFATTDFQPELKTRDNWCVSMGSGQTITDPFLGLMRQAFAPSGPPNLQDGLFMVAWALEHVIKLNPGGINGPCQIGVIRQGGQPDAFEARILEDAEITEHVDSSRAAVRHLSQFRQSMQAQHSPPVPTPPSFS